MKKVSIGDVYKKYFLKCGIAGFLVLVMLVLVLIPFGYDRGGFLSLPYWAIPFAMTLTLFQKMFDVNLGFESAVAMTTIIFFIGGGTFIPLIIHFLKNK